MTTPALKFFGARYLILVLAAPLLLLTAFNKNNPLKAYYLNGVAQGTTYHITYFCTDSIIKKTSVDSLLNNIDSSLSLYKPYSLINQFNASARGVAADKNMREVIKKSKEVFNNTSGIFDITIGPLVSAWGFGVAPVHSFPDANKIDALMKCVGAKNIYLKRDSLIKNKPCINIDVNGIAQGYSVDLLARQLEKYGIRNYLVELGGELRVKGRKQPGGGHFRIGIESPAKNSFDEPLIQSIISLQDGAITTSGNYRKYKENGAKKISHLIDARTGYPVDNELISVTVWSPEAITADGYDNALMAMGLVKAKQFVEKRKDMEAYFIYKKKDGSVKDTATRGFYKFIINQ